jgi:hypothetical protein
MKISDENQKRGWTPELRKLVEEHGEATIRCFIRDFSIGGRWCGVPLGILGDVIATGLDPKTVYAMSATIRALPFCAVEVYGQRGGWLAASHPIAKDVAVRVRSDWKLGEWVEDEPELTGGDLLDEIIEKHGLPCCLTIGARLCYLHNDGNDDVRLSWDGKYAYRFAVDGWYFLKELCDPEEINRKTVRVVKAEAMRVAKGQAADAAKENE